LDPRLALSGIVVSGASAAFLVVGLAAGEPRVAGPSISGLVVGLTLLTLGLTFREPALEAISSYARALGAAARGISEDLGLLGGHELQACPGDDGVLVALAPAAVSCSSLTPGVGVTSDGTPYLALEVPKPSLEGATGLESIIALLAPAGRVTVRRSGSSIEVALDSVHPGIYLWSLGPIAPVRILTAAAVASSLGAPLRLVSEDVEEASRSYRASYEVVEA
jgi:hypothetical protein